MRRSLPRVLGDGHLTLRLRRAAWQAATTHPGPPSYRGDRDRRDSWGHGIQEAHLRRRVPPGRGVESRRRPVSQTRKWLRIWASTRGRCAAGCRRRAQQVAVVGLAGGRASEGKLSLATVIDLSSSRSVLGYAMTARHAPTWPSRPWVFRGPEPVPVPFLTCRRSGSRTPGHGSSSGHFTPG